MASLFRLAQSALAPTSAHGYSNPHHPHLADPDLDAFQDDDLPSDDDDDDEGHASDREDHRTHAGQQRRSPAGAQSAAGAVPTTAAGSSSAAPPPPHEQTRVPGAYDFEPQAEPIRSVTAGPRRGTGASRPRLATTTGDGGALALPQSRRASHSSRHFRDEGIAQPSSAYPGSPQSGDQPTLAVWRGLVTRLRGGNHPDPSSAAGRAGREGEEGHGLLFSQDDSEDPSDADWPRAPRDANQYPPPRDPHLPLPPRPPQFAPPPAAAAAASSSSATPAASQRVFGGGQGNDGVFANLAAKPDNPGGLDIVGEGPDKDEILPVRLRSLLRSFSHGLCSERGGGPETDHMHGTAYDGHPSLTKPRSTTRHLRTGKRPSSLRVVRWVRMTSSLTACRSATCSAFCGTCSSP